MLEIPKIDPSAYVAPTAQIHGAVIIDARAVVMFGAVMRAEVEHIRVGAESNVQDNVVFHVDEGYPLDVGSRVTVGHAAVLHGCSVGDHALIGIGAIAMNGSTIGEGAWLAAGSLLAPGKAIPPWTLAAGTPARPVRELRDVEIAAQDDGVEQYLRFAELYRA